MKIINSSVSIKQNGYTLKDIYQSIEEAGRVSYASVGTQYFRIPKTENVDLLKANPSILVKEAPFFDKNYYVSIPHKLVNLFPELSNYTEEKLSDSPLYENRTAEEFCNMIKKNGHLSVFEFGTVYLMIDCSEKLLDVANKYVHNKYSKWALHEDGKHYCITTNMRVIVENGYESDLKYLCEPTKYHEKRMTAEFICSRAIANEIVRHRVMSFIQESQRYCAYNSDKFENSVKFIKPTWINDLDKPYSKMLDSTRCWYRNMKTCELHYFKLLNAGIKPQFARGVLPNDTATKIYVCGFESDWNHFFDLRCSQRAHPDLKILADNLKQQFNCGV